MKIEFEKVEETVIEETVTEEVFERKRDTLTEIALEAALESDICSNRANRIGLRLFGTERSLVGPIEADTLESAARHMRAQLRELNTFLAGLEAQIG